LNRQAAKIAEPLSEALIPRWTFSLLAQYDSVHDLGGLAVNSSSVQSVSELLLFRHSAGPAHERFSTFARHLPLSTLGAAPGHGLDVELKTSAPGSRRNVPLPKDGSEGAPGEVCVTRARQVA
jgi:hypothetical protein